MDQPPGLMLGTSAVGRRIRYDATLDVQMQVQLHIVSVSGDRHMRGILKKCLIRFVRARFRRKGRKGCTVDQAYGDAHPLQLRGAAWRKSSYSNPSGNCVETARLPAGQMAVRDSKRPGPALIFSPAEWAAFLTAVRAASIP
jgi:hypothetical protein